MPRPSKSRNSKTTRASGPSLANAAPNAPTMPRKPKNPVGPKSHGTRSAKHKAPSPTKTQHLEAMLGQLDTPLPGAVPRTADGDEGGIPEGPSSRPNVATSPGAAVPPNTTVSTIAGNDEILTKGSSSQPDVAAPDVAAPDVAAPDVAAPDVAASDVVTPSEGNGNDPIVVNECEHKRLGSGEEPVLHLDENRNRMKAHPFHVWTSGLLTGFLGLENWDCVDGGFDELRRCILKFARSMTETVDWASLDVETQQMLKSWAPKANEYLETPEGARVIFQGWLWRIVVDDIIGGPGDQPHWTSYSELLRVIEPLTNLMPDALRADQKETNFAAPFWRTVVAERLKNRHLLWRALTMELLRSARGGTKFRYNFESVVALLRQKLGRWLQPVKNNGKLWTTLNQDLTELAETAIGLDWYIHCNQQNWKFSFTDPETGQAHGFLYRKHPEVRPHSISNDPRYHEGYPVDLVVTPSFRSWGDFNKPAGDWGAPWVKAPMEVAIDMLPPSEEEESIADGGEDSAGHSANRAKDGAEESGDEVVSGLGS